MPKLGILILLILLCQIEGSFIKVRYIFGNEVAWSGYLNGVPFFDQDSSQIGDTLGKPGQPNYRQSCLVQESCYSSNHLSVDWEEYACEDHLRISLFLAKTLTKIS